MKAKIDPVDEFFALCYDIDGSLHKENVRYALACAYRQGFAEAKDQVPTLLQLKDNMRCSVESPRPVVSEAQAMRAEIEKRLTR